MNKMKLGFPKQTKSVLIIILIFILISFLYFPSCLSGKALDANDYNNFYGVSKELRDFKSTTGEDALWTNSMFGGMPAYLIYTHYKGNIFRPYFFLIGSIPKPLNYIIVNFCLFFLLGLIFGANRWISFAGALAYGFTSYFFIVLAEGHITKVQSLIYYSLLISGIYLAYNKNRISGALLFAVGLSLLLSVNHPQMSYYAAILVSIIVITYFIYALIEKTLTKFFKTSGLLVGAAILAIGIGFGPLLSTYEYGKYSSRGKSELISSDYNKTSGLDRGYILDYSYDFGEALTAFIPGFRGGSNSEHLDLNSKTYKLLEEDQGKEAAKKLIQSTPLYWGSQPITRGPFYYGAVLCFLFVLGLFIVKGKEKWWIVAVVIIAFILSLGKNIPFLSNWMIDHFPGYNKFRDVKGIIVIQQFAMALMMLLTVKEVYLRNIDTKKFIRVLKYSFYITGGLALLFFIIPGFAGNFSGSYDEILTKSQGWPPKFIDALISDRKTALRDDAFRTFIFVSLAAVVLWMFWAKKIKAGYALTLWIILIIADLWPIDKKYLNDTCFVSKKRAEHTFLPTIADNIILRDKDPNYRVLNISLDPFTDASTSYFHKSIGGNNGAKMRRYHEMIYFNISREILALIKILENPQTQYKLDSLLSVSNSLNMLNTRYIILIPDAEPVMNPYASGNAWFVNNYKIVKNADEEVRAIKDIDVRYTAVIDRRFEGELSGKSFGKDSLSFIKLKSYAPNKLVYQTNCSSEQLAVFSEIYYPNGWIVKIDGKETGHFWANYILRSMVVPAGNHEIVFEFKPQSYRIGNTVSLASSILLVIAAVGVAFSEYKKRIIV